MEFNHFLSSYFPDPSVGGKQLFDDMLQQAIFADQSGYASVSIPEHHLVNILLNPAPLTFAVKVAAHTSKVDIVTSIAILPIHDMRTYAGEVAMADILTDGRLVLGVGKGAFAYEIERLCIPMSETQPRFTESLDVLTRLLTEKEVSYQGDYYNFEALTIMPRPLTQPMPRIMVAVMAPEKLYQAASSGYHVQTTALAGNHQMMVDQIAAFQRGKAEHSHTLNQPSEQKLSLLRLCYVAKDKADAAAKLNLAYDYFKRFDNAFGGPGIVKDGCLQALPRTQTKAELAENVLIGTADEINRKLEVYANLGIDELICNINVGASQDDAMAAMERMANHVLPNFSHLQAT
ncbi:MAG TPA: LLM class flavin-dependent oxidoreductase [Oceanospirillaceae bacterium]|nr:LLM class flavin-dependent oxidoreductase [Oceanospirillaceae bacterium]